MLDSNIRLLKEKDEEIFELRCQLNDARNFKLNNQELHDALIHDFKKTISVIGFSFIHIYMFLFDFQCRLKCCQTLVWSLTEFDHLMSTIRKVSLVISRYYLGLSGQRLSILDSTQLAPLF